MKKIVIIEPGSSALYIANAVKHLGYEPVILCSINEYSGEPKYALQKQGYYEVNAKSVDAILQCIEENKIDDIFGVISTADRFIVQACEVARKLDVNGMDPALLKLNNKADVVRFIPEHSPSTLVFNKDAIPFSQLKDLLGMSGAIVVKPASSAGAKGLFEVKTEEEIDCLIDFMKKEKQADVIDKDWLAQPVINGTLYSLEGFVVNGQVRYIGLSRRSRIKYTESQNHFPAENETQDSIYSELTAVLEKLVNVSGYKRGYFHSEILYDGQKAYLIDANFGRVGGGSIALQIAKSTGKSIEDVYAHVLETTFFPERLSHSTFYPKEKIKTLSILYGVEQASTFVELSLADITLCMHVQIAEKGKELKPVGMDNRSWIGFLIGTPDEVLREINLISIITDKGALKPVF
ncbi:MAG: ATP-grasp domain-containing protein [Pseudomonadota bacterium]